MAWKANKLTKKQELKWNKLYLALYGGNAIPADITYAMRGHSGSHNKNPIRNNKLCFQLVSSLSMNTAIHLWKFLGENILKSLKENNIKVVDIHKGKRIIRIYL